MEKLFKQLSLTLQNAEKTKIPAKKKQRQPIMGIKKYNSETTHKFRFYKPISKIVNM